jgi:hypothetical protein
VFGRSLVRRRTDYRTTAACGLISNKCQRWKVLN